MFLTSPKHTRKTFRLRFAVALARSFASRSRNRATSCVCNVETSRLALVPMDSRNRSIIRLYRSCVDRSASIDFVSSHFSHHDWMVALSNDSTLAAVKTSLTPCAITSRAASALSLPLCALFAAFSHVRQIACACFLSLDFVERKTRFHLCVCKSKIENAQNQNGLPGCL